MIPPERNRCFLLLLLAATCLFSACQPSRGALSAALPPWQLADVRVLDPADAPTPDLDLVALSLRHIQGQVQLRLDWLDIAPEQAGDVQIDFYTHSGSTLRISLAQNGEVTTTKPLPGLRVQWDSFFDITVISFQDTLSWLRAPYRVRVRSESTGLMVDEIGPVESNGTPPEAEPMLLAFWNVFPAVTPAQALRQWDGAHSGPQRERHGLRYLLEAAKAMQTPLFLLDLKTPAALSALDTVGGIDELQYLAKRGLAVLPDTALLDGTVPGWFAQQTLTESRQVGLDFGLPGSSLVYTPANADGTPPCLGRQALSDGNGALQATSYGPALETRRILANAAPNDGYTLLGGDFAADAWGNPQAVSATLRYLAARPWLKFLDATGIAELTDSRFDDACKAKLISPNITTSETTWPTIFDELAHTPDNALRQSAQQMLEMLLAPAEPTLTALRQNYVGQVGHLLAAARWADNPAATADCSQDLDGDGAAECVLASEQFFAVIEPVGGYISVAVTVVDGEIHQVIAPSWQFTVGLGDPMDWKPERGIASDPSAFPGAFFNPMDKWQVYIATTAPGRVILDGENGSKVFEVESGRLQVAFAGDAGAQQTITLALDAWRRFRPAWAGDYGVDASGQKWGWGLAHEPQVWLEVGEASISSKSFSESLPFLNTPEDPNFAYPAGHFLPFPLAVVTVDGAKSIVITVQK
jgi:hypothetical protein